MTSAMEDTGTVNGRGTAVCGAKTRSGGTCQKPSGWGTPGTVGRCSLHGGNTPSHRKAAQTLAARTAVATYGLPRDVQPHQALMEELHRTAGHVAWLGAIIADMEADELTHLIVSEEGSASRSGRREVIDERVSVWVKLYQDERQHFTRVAKTCADVGVEERLIRQVESLGSSVALVLKEFCRRMGLPLDDPSTKEAVVGSLRLIEPGEGT